jgi:hypothetical protein
MSSTYSLENQSYLRPSAHWRPFGLAHWDVDLNMGRLTLAPGNQAREGIALTPSVSENSPVDCLTILARRSSIIHR